jgi:hypothetical protein
MAEMRGDERQRQMDFIVNSLAQLTTKAGSMADIQKADAVRFSRLEDAFVTRSYQSESSSALASIAGACKGIEQAIVTLTRLGEQRNGDSQVLFPAVRH